MRAPSVFWIGWISWLAAGCGEQPGTPDSGEGCGACADAPGPDALADAPIDGPSIAPCPSAQWCIETAPIPVATRLHGAWAASINDVFAVGASGTIIRRHDGSWSAMQSGSTETLHGIWGASATNVWAVGSNGALLHFDGTGWTPATGVTTSDLYSIWGSSATDIWVAGSGVVLHGNGTSWTSTNLAGTLMSISGTGPSDVWVTGESSGVRHYTGGPAWASSNPGNGLTYFGVLAIGAGNVFVSSATPTREWMRYTGSGWAPYSTTNTIYQAFHAFSVTDVWAVATTKIGHWDSATWTVEQPSVITMPVWGIAGAAGHIWVVGDSATIAHRSP